MAPFLIAVVVIAGVGSIGGVLVRRGRARALVRLRAGWGHPVDRERRLDAMLATHRARTTGAGGRSLDARTWADLDLDAVFAVVDRTRSTLGQHALYHRLRSSPVADHLDAFEALTSRFETDHVFRERAQIALSRLQDPHGYDLWWLAGEDAIETRSWYAVFPTLTAVTIGLTVVALLSPGLTPALVGMLIVNVAVRYATDRRIAAVASAFRQIAPIVAAAESLRFVDGEDVRVLAGAIRADTPRLGRLKMIARWLSGNPLMVPMDADSLAIALNDVVSAAYEYLNLALLLDGNAVFLGARRLRADHPALLRVIAAIGEVDAAISTASVRASHDWTRPSFRPPGLPAELVDLRHPLLSDAVPNTITLVAGRGVLITGSNMSGKSTFLRTVGVNAVLAQTLHTCLGSRYHAPVFDVRSCIGRSDDLAGGRSYYVVEVESLLELVATSGLPAPHLFLLDELFRGTNAVERIAAGQAVLLELVSDSHRPRPHVVLAATHDGELVDLLPERYDAVHFGDAIGPEGLFFDHRLRPGPATTRNAIALLDLHGAPRDLIRRATECAAALDAQRGTTVRGR